MIVEPNPKRMLTLREISLKYEIPEITLGRLLDKNCDCGQTYDKGLHRYFNENEAYKTIKEYRSEMKCVEFPIFGDKTRGI